MVTKICQCCNYTSNHKWAFEQHLLSKRHLERINNADNKITYFNCIHCAKKYNSKSGLRRHVLKCTKKLSLDTASPARADPVYPTEELTNAIIAIHDELKEIRKTQALVVPSNHQTNNITTNNQHIHVYLNTHCPNAMNMKQFIDSISLNPTDFDVFFKKQFYEGSLKILQKQFSDLAITERPMHCINPVLNRPKTFFIKDQANEWKEESQGDFVYQMKCIEEWQNEEKKMLLTQFFERINDKMWDTWKEVCETNPRYKNIYERMHRVSNSDDKMSVLDDLGSTLAMET